MQICYRCEEKTNEFLEKIAKKKGISKNRLIDEIVKNYLKHGYSHTDVPHPSTIEKDILTGIQFANRQLTQILDELNRFPMYTGDEISDEKFNDSFQFFRTYVIQLLCEISKTLEAIRKKYHPPGR